ncbi:MAG: hypothetical protein R2867_01625 [Caldilineaceae bacterium]
MAVSSVDANGAESVARLADGIHAPCAMAPMGLMVGALPNGLVHLQWQDQAPNETGFEIERAEMPLNTIAPGPYRLIATVAADTTVYTDTPLRPFHYLLVSRACRQREWHFTLFQRKLQLDL